MRKREICDECGEWFDTDRETEVEVKDETLYLCWNCRNKYNPFDEPEYDQNV